MMFAQFGSLLANVHDSHRSTFVDWLIDAAAGHYMDGYLLDQRGSWLRVELRPWRDDEDPTGGLLPVKGVTMESEEVEPCDLLKGYPSPVLVGRHAMLA